jgi:FixJ family two-component response regulator
MALSRRVYVIEDDEPVARSLVALLNLYGYQASRFATADRFLAAVDSLAPGCMLIDQLMPGTDGLAAVRALAKRGCRWPAILMTGEALAIVEAEAKRAGVHSVLEKPFDIDRLRAELDALQGQVPAVVQPHLVPPAVPDRIEPAWRPLAATSQSTIGPGKAALVG